MTRTHSRTWWPGARPALVCLVLAVTGCSAGAVGTPPARPDDARPAASASVSAPATARAPSTKAADPVRVTISSIGVSSSLMRLGLNRDGTIEVPPAEKGMTAGWYTGGAVPGERGAAVIIGHNDTRFGRAVFHDLKKVGKGADIAVRNSAGASAHFTVTGTETVSKKAFPTEKVYGETDGRELRLITCDGSFDAQGHPVDNLIVYATRR